MRAHHISSLGPDTAKGRAEGPQATRQRATRTNKGPTSMRRPALETPGSECHRAIQPLKRKFKAQGKLGPGKWGGEPPARRTCWRQLLRGSGDSQHCCASVLVTPKQGFTLHPQAPRSRRPAASSRVWPRRASRKACGRGQRESSPTGLQEASAQACAGEGRGLGGCAEDRGLALEPAFRAS